MAPQKTQVIVVAVNVERGWKSLVQPVAPGTVFIQQPQYHSLVRIRIDVQQPTVEFIPG